MADQPDLLSLVLHLRPAEKVQAEAALPRWWGRAAHALLLTVIRARDDTLAARLHAGQQIRPFTVSTLMGSFPEGRLDREQAYTLRLTGFSREIADHLLAAAQTGGALSPGREVELDYRPFQIEAALWEPGEHPWAGLDRYPELGATYLLAQEKPSRRLTLAFTSPTTFKSMGMHVPIPLPELLIRSLWAKWNAYASLAFPEEVVRFARECLAISRYRLSSRVVPMKSRGVRMGGIGRATYVALNYDRYWMSVVHTLAHFARYAGVGAGTSMGMGQCRLVDGSG